MMATQKKPIVRSGELRLLIMSEYGTISEFARQRDLNYQLTSATIHGRANYKKFREAIKREFGVERIIAG